MLKVKSSRTITRFKTTPHNRPALRLFCFHNAGGSASFFSPWADSLPPQIEVCAVQLPGREDRRGEPALDSLEEVLDLLVEELRPYLLELPFAFFGHGMGALVAFELSHRLRAQGLPGPEHLFVAGQPAPQLDHPFGPLAALPDEALTAAVTRLGGIPQGVLRRPSFLALVLADLRADFRLCANYGHDQTRRPLGCPITAFGGGGDPLVSGWQLRAWSFQTRGRFELRILSGGHGFLRASRSHVLAVVRERLCAPAEALRRAS